MPDVTVTPTLTISATAPASPAAGDLWWNSAIGVFFVYYDDGSSQQWVTTQPVKYINLAQIEGPAGGDLSGYYPNPSIKDAVELEYPLLKNPLLLNDYTQKLASTKWVTDMFASFGLLGQVTQGPGILLTPNPMAGDSTIALLAIDPVIPAGDYGAANETAAITVDIYGRITAAAGIPIPPINSPAFTGIPTAPTALFSTDTAQIATTAFVQDVFDNYVPGIYAPLNSPNFTGDPRAPTPLFADDDTSIATTQWVRDVIAGTAGRVFIAGADSFPTTDARFLYDLTVGRLALTVADAQQSLLLRGATKGARFVPTAAGFTIEGVDNTGSASYQPLTMGGLSLAWTLSGVQTMTLVAGTGLTVAAPILAAGGDVAAADINILSVGATSDNAIQGRIYNGDTGNTAVARLGVELTGVANAYGLFGIYKNSGSPYLFIDKGSAVSGLRLNMPLWLNSGVALPAGGLLGGGVNFSSTANFGINYGSGVPDKAMARGSIYLRSDGSPYFNNDGTGAGWRPLGGTVNVSDTAPVSPNDGQLWWNSVLGQMFIYYNDGSTSQWVPASPASLADNGKLLQTAYFETGSYATGTTTIPADNTIPQITEGDQYMTLAFTPLSPVSFLFIDVVLNGGTSIVGGYAAALFQDAIANALAAFPNYNAIAGGTNQLSFTHVMVSGSTTARTFRVRAGSNSAATFAMNGSTGGAYFGLTCASSIVVREVLL